MTMPSERMRALRWAEQLLREIRVDPLVPSKLQHRAAELSRLYPSQARLRDILSEPSARLPRELATVVFDAGMLFEAMNVPGRMTPATRDLLGGVMRHFPSRGAFKKRKILYVKPPASIEDWFSARSGIGMTSGSSPKRAGRRTSYFPLTARTPRCGGHRPK